MLESNSSAELSKPLPKKQKSAPRAFIFDDPRITKAKESDALMNVRESNPTVSFYLPIITQFEEENIDISLAYQDLSNSILKAYNELRINIADNLGSELSEIIFHQELTQPIGLVSTIKEIALCALKKIEAYRNKEKSYTQQLCEEYERLLQKSESKIRDYIRNEQIHKLNYEYVVAQNDQRRKLLDDSEDAMKVAQDKLKELVEDNTRMANLLKKKDSDLKSAKDELSKIRGKPGSGSTSSGSNKPPTNSPASKSYLNSKSTCVNSQNESLSDQFNPNPLEPNAQGTISLRSLLNNLKLKSPQEASIREKSFDKLHSKSTTNLRKPLLESNESNNNDIIQEIMKTDSNVPKTTFLNSNSNSNMINKLLTQTLTKESEDLKDLEQYKAPISSESRNLSNKPFQSSQSRGVFRTLQTTKSMEKLSTSTKRGLKTPNDTTRSDQKKSFIDEALVVADPPSSKRKENKGSRLRSVNPSLIFDVQNHSSPDPKNKSYDLSKYTKIATNKHLVSIFKKVNLNESTSTVNKGFTPVRNLFTIPNKIKK